MLTEIVSIRQVPGEARRRWFNGERMDLILWFDDAGEVTSFQICYDKEVDEHALTWRRGEGFTHERVDEGESRPGKSKATPILLADGSFPAERVAAAFRAEAQRVDAPLRELVEKQVLSLAGGGG